MSSLHCTRLMTGTHLASEAYMGELSTMEHVQRETGRIDDRYALMDSLKEKNVDTETKV